MAMEGHYQSHPEGAPLILVGIPNSAYKRVDHAIQIPKVSSLILKHDANAPLAGLDTIPEDEHPPMGVVFWSRSEEHTSELQSLMRISYAVFCLTKQTQ